MRPPFDPSWTLFLDRDGVINVRPERYITRVEDLVFLPGAIAGIARLSQWFGRVCVVTNQQGVGKGLMSTADLAAIHGHLLAETAAAGGRLDAVYFSPHLKTDPHSTRKPGPAMALQAQQDFPEIDLARSVMLGDAVSDMQFGARLGMYTVFVEGEGALAEQEKVALTKALATDAGLYVRERCASLWDWAALF